MDKSSQASTGHATSLQRTPCAFRRILRLLRVVPSILPIRGDLLPKLIRTRRLSERRVGVGIYSETTAVAIPSDWSELWLSHY